METIQSLEIENTPIQKFSIATTAISEIELGILNLPENITLSPTLTPRTRFLITYKAIFTEKYIQALKWSIPIISASFLYDFDSNYKKYEIKAFQGALFSTSGISEEIYSNYFILLGAKYEPNCTIFIDFLICDTTDSEKYKFCLKYNIPIIRTSDVFKNDYSLFTKKMKYDAKQLKPKAMFFEKVFYLDQSLPKVLFNKLRRIIIEHEGTRISTLSDEIDYLVAMNPDHFKEHQSKIIHYQYIFDCHESRSLLFSEFYKANPVTSRTVLTDAVAVVDKKLSDAGEYVNKLKSMGAVVKSSLDMRVTHYFSKAIDRSILRSFSKPTEISSLKTKRTDLEDCLPFKIINPEWIDQCLCTLKHVKESKFLSNRPLLNLKKRINNRRIEEEVVFQFTGLPTYFRDEAIRKFRQFNIKFIDSDKFEGCTHLIMGALNSSEKFFSSLVNGCWILRPDFIQDFENQPNFDFEKYEWRSTAETTPKDKRIIDSVKKWRTRIQEGGNPPFHRWNAKIYCLEVKRENYTKLIVNGGGEMNDSKKYTHVFIDKGYPSESIKEDATNIDSIFSYLFK